MDFKQPKTIAVVAVGVLVVAGAVFALVHQTGQFNPKPQTSNSQASQVNPVTAFAEFNKDMQAKNFDGAAETMKNLASSTNDKQVKYQATLNLATAYMDKQDFQSAEDQFQSAIKLNGKADFGSALGAGSADLGMLEQMLTRPGYDKSKAHDLYVSASNYFDQAASLSSDPRDQSVVAQQRAVLNDIETHTHI